jgi:membrane protease YdiL (CAAX protease family)
MTPFAAVGWTLAVLLGATLLISITATAREGAERDFVNNFVCLTLAMLGGLFGILRVHAPNASIRDWVALRPTHPGFFALAIAMGAAVYLPVSVLFSAIVRRFPVPDEGGIERIFLDAGRVERVFIGLAAVALGPIVEEVFFRGALFTPLKARLRTAQVVAITAFLFAASHALAQQILPLALVGVLLGVMRAVSGSLLPAVLLHATFNAVPMWTLATGRAPPEGDANAPLPLGPAAIGLAVTLALLAATLWLARRSETAARARARDRA